MDGKEKSYRLHAYTKEDLDNALKVIREGRKSIGKVATEYDIPKSTLHSKLRRKVPEYCKKGPSPVLLEEEEQRLAKWIKDKAKLGFPMHPDEVKDAVKKVLDEAGRQTVFKNNRPGNKWLKLFLRRHNEITIKNAEILSRSRASVTEEKLRQWFVEVMDYLKENNFQEVLNRPRSIFNGDETGVQLSPRTGRLLGEKKDKNFYELASGSEKEALSVLCTFSAAGDTLPPMIVYPKVNEFSTLNTTKKDIPQVRIISRPKSLDDYEKIWDKHLSWSLTGQTDKEKKIKKEPVPAAITGYLWREKELKRKEEKARKELELKVRKLQRQIKKEENLKNKQKLKEEKEKMKQQKMKLKKEDLEKTLKIKQEKLLSQKKKASDKPKKSKQKSNNALKSVERRVLAHIDINSSVIEHKTVDMYVVQESPLNLVMN